MIDCFVCNLYFCRLFCPQPALSSSALCALCILFVALPTSFFVVSSQWLLKYSWSPHRNPRDLDSSVYVCFQACTRQRPCTMAYGYQGSGAQTLANCSGKLYGLGRVRHGKMLGFFPPIFFMHFTMLGFAPDSISCISFITYFYVCLAGDRTWSIPRCFRQHVQLSSLGAGNQKLLDVASTVRLARKLWGWTPQNYSMLFHMKTRGEKNSTPCATTFGSLIPNLGIWIQGSGAAGHVSSMTYFSNFWKIKTR